MVALVKGDSILQLTEGGHRSLATEHFSKSVQRNDKRDIGLAVAGHIGGAVTKGEDDMRDSMSGLNGKAVKVKRVAISSPVSMIVDPAFRVQLFGVPIALDSMYYVVF